ncbi:MAG TPA: GNAT family N-acetyltransferase [Steroidobacteraceae bacterium]|nr:GNAT family N-acetyltransferase [Steroidobacteraceae bacterium]
MNPELSFKKAMAADAERIAALVNSGYRGDASRAGWTTEADYLVGKRTDANEIRALIADPEAAILLCLAGDDVVGSVHLQRHQGAAYLGMFVVQPSLQGKGLGKRFLQAAEEFVKTKWRVAKVEMTVITLRDKLISYYERRGYRRTGVFKPFPIEDKRSTALVENLQFEVLEKRL